MVLGQGHNFYLKQLSQKNEKENREGKRESCTTREHM